YNQRISLSMKELLPNEWEEYANSHGVGDVDTGSVTNVTDFGVFVELAPGVEGLCHISEIDRDEGLSLAEMFTPGQQVQCRILRVDWHESRIGLSMHGVGQEVSAETGTETAEVSQPETAMAAALRLGGVVESEIEAFAADESVSEEAAEATDEVAVDESAAEDSAEVAEDVAVDESAADEAVEAADDIAEVVDEELTAEATEDPGDESDESDSDDEKKSDNGA
ncbi:MAG: S1 RNA-binding domain-containing protein, partial [Thermoanaerobaculales bacterium]|nr:S1 RNA-binding domain-containing protein [Thermoanaerobaculales bacterium]